MDQTQIIFCIILIFLVFTFIDLDYQTNETFENTKVLSPNRKVIYHYHNPKVDQKLRELLDHKKDIQGNYFFYLSPLTGKRYNNNELTRVLNRIESNMNCEDCTDSEYPLKDTRYFISWIWNHQRFSTKSNLGKLKRYDLYPKYFYLPLSSTDYKELIDESRSISSDFIPKYVLKNNDQKQKGVLITDDLRDISDKYLFVQKYIDSPCYKGHKFSLRYYLIIVMDPKGDPFYYIHHDGIVTYPKNTDDQVSSFNNKENYLEKGFPITIGRLVNKTPNFDWEGVTMKIREKIGKLAELMILESRTFKETHIPVTTFQLFGVDIIIDKTNLEPYILEVNYGPGMDPLLDEDKKVRYDVYRALISLLNIE